MLAQDLANRAVGLDANMRREDDERLALGGHVVREGREAGLAHEGQARQATECKVLAPARLHQVDHLAGDEVNLVGADARGEERIVLRVPARAERLRCEPIHGVASKCAREVLVARSLCSTRRDGEPRHL